MEIKTMKTDPLQSQKPKVRVLIADDHAVVRNGLVAIIEAGSEMEVVAEAGNGLEAVAQWQTHHPDIILVDLRMPELDGLGAIKKIRQLDPSARVIILTTFDDDENIYQGIVAGAKGYLLKDSSKEDILNCIRKVNDGQTCLPSMITAKLAERVGGVELTDRELSVLHALASGQSNKEIGQQLCITEGTVKIHLKSIYKKLHVLSRTEAIVAATRRGLVRH